MLRWLPVNISSFGQGVDNLFTLIYWITFVVFVLVMATLVFFLIKYRHREGVRAEYIEGSTKLEIIWTTATTIIVFGLAMLSFPQWNNIKSPSEFPTNPDLVVQVRAKQFNWKVIYPGPDNEFNTDAGRDDELGTVDDPGDDLKKLDVMHVPIGKVVHVRLISEDVIHSFFVPQLRLKQDALPNRFINVWFDTKKIDGFDAESNVVASIVDLENIRKKGCYTGTLTFSDENTPSVTGNIVLETDETLTLSMDGELNTYNKSDVKQLDVMVWRFEIPCAELCGYGHGGMVGHLYVHTQESYDVWLAEEMSN